MTIIGLPLGIFLVRRAGRLFSPAVSLMLPLSLAHPVQEMKKSKKKKRKSLERRLGL